MSEKVEVVRTSDRYNLVVAPTIDEGSDRPVYQIINKRWGVVEAEAVVLPQALAYQDQLEEANNEYETSKEKSDVNILPFNH